MAPVHLSRRSFLASTAAVAASVAVPGCSPRASGLPQGGATSVDAARDTGPALAARMPVAFVGHGAPTLATDLVKGADLRRWASAMPRPRAIVVLSAHWEDAPVSVGFRSSNALMYDFRGFPDELYRMRYDAPMPDELGRQIVGLLGSDGSQVLTADRPLDHGAWVPLLHLVPDADVPVVQVSLPTRQGASNLIRIGQRLASLRDEGVLLLGSGNLVHNLRRLAPDGSPVPGWASAFDAWATEALEAGDIDALAQAASVGPDATLAHPTWEHWLPILVAATAAEGAPVRFPVTGFEYGNISRRCVQFG